MQPLLYLVAKVVVLFLQVEQLLIIIAALPIIDLLESLLAGVEGEPSTLDALLGDLLLVLQHVLFRFELVILCLEPLELLS